MSKCNGVRGSPWLMDVKKSIRVIGDYMKVEEIEHKIEKYTYMKESFNRHKEISSEDDLYTKIYKMYLNLESIAKITKIVNEQGYRIPSVKGERKYGFNDISNILSSEYKEINKELSYIVHQLFRLNKSGQKEKEWDARWLE